MDAKARVAEYLRRRYRKHVLRTDEIARELLVSEEEVRRLLGQGKLKGLNPDAVAAYIVNEEE